MKGSRTGARRGDGRVSQRGEYEGATGERLVVAVTLQPTYVSR